MKLNSREYQSHLFPALFADPDEGFRQWRTFAAQLHPAVQCRYEPQSVVWFEQVVYDTPHNTFAAANMKLRVRVYADYMKCTHKIASHDRYSIAAVPINCVDRAARIKFEEDIHAYHTIFVKQATSLQKTGSQFARVQDWTRIFRSVAGLADPQEQLLAGPSLFIVRQHGLYLIFKELEVKTLFDLKYANPDHTRLVQVEFSWKYREPDEAYQPEITRLMRHFYQAIHQSDWVDLAADLAKCQRDAGLTVLNNKCE